MAQLGPGLPKSPCRGQTGSFVFRSAGFQPALFLECGGWTLLSPRFVGAGFSPSLSSSFSPHSPATVAGHSPLLYGAGGSPAVPGDRREVSLTLKGSNHYQPNHQNNKNISKRPASPDFPQTPLIR